MLHIPDQAWRSHESGALLTSFLEINGCTIHLTAFAVGRDASGCQVAETAQPLLKAKFDALSLAHGRNKPWHEIMIRGRAYALFACPSS